MIKVDYDNLMRLLENYVETFNDCAYCPVDWRCEIKRSVEYGKISPYECARFLRDDFFNATSVVKRA